MTPKLPKHWSLVSLEDCAEVNPRTHIADTTKEATFLAMGDVSETGEIIGGSTVELASIGSGYTRFQTNDVLVAKITPCFENGKGALAHGLANDIGFGSTEFHVLRAKEKVLPPFLHLITTTHRFRATGEFTMSGSAGQKRVPAEFLRSYPIQLPLRTEQARIVETISAWDATIRKTEQLIAAKRQQQEILTTKLYNLSNRQGMPARFGSVLTESSVSGTSGRDARKLSIKLYGKGVVAKDEKRVGSAQTQYFVRRAGQLVYSKLDFLNGAFGIVPEELDGYESTVDLPAFDIASGIDPRWLLGYLTRPTYYTRQVGLARGQRKARRIHSSDLLASSLHVPPFDLQQRIAEILKAMQVDIETSTRLLAALQKQKRGLMQKLLTGQWRVKTAETDVC